MEFLSKRGCFIKAASFVLLCFMQFTAESKDLGEAGLTLESAVNYTIDIYYCIIIFTFEKSRS